MWFPSSSSSEVILSGIRSLITRIGFVSTIFTENQNQKVLIRTQTAQIRFEAEYSSFGMNNIHNMDCYRGKVLLPTSAFCRPKRDEKWGLWRLAHYRSISSDFLFFSFSSLSDWKERREEKEKRKKRDCVMNRADLAEEELSLLFWTMDRTEKESHSVKWRQELRNLSPRTLLVLSSLFWERTPDPDSRTWLQLNWFQESWMSLSSGHLNQDESSFFFLHSSPFAWRGKNFREKEEEEGKCVN